MAWHERTINEGAALTALTDLIFTALAVFGAGLARLIRPSW